MFQICIFHLKYLTETNNKVFNINGLREAIKNCQTLDNVEPSPSFF